MTGKIKVVSKSGHILEYNYRHLNFVRFQEDMLIVNYTDKDGEVREEIGEMPNFFEIRDENERRLKCRD